MNGSHPPSSQPYLASDKTRLIDSINSNSWKSVSVAGECRLRDFLIDLNKADSYSHLVVFAGKPTSTSTEVHRVTTIYRRPDPVRCTTKDGVNKE